MVSDTFFGLVALLYYLGFLLLIGLTLSIALRGRRRTPTRSRLRRTFFWLALSLILWQFTLFLEDRTVLPTWQLWLGRVNFSAIVFAAYLAFRFVQEVSVKERKPSTPLSFWLNAETWLLAILTLFTPFVDASERVEAGHAVTTFGSLFPVYLLHGLGYWTSALLLAFWEKHQTKDWLVRGQLTLIGIGMLTTGGITFFTNALLPYVFGDFRFCDVGTLSTVCFVLAIAYATFVHRLFNLRIFLRETLVYGILMTFVLGAYSSTVFVVTQYLTNSAGKLTQFAVLLIAFSFDPLRRFLEEKTDRLLFSERDADGKRRKKRSSKQGGNARRLALIFPWRRQ